MGRQRHAPADLLPKNTRFPFYMWLGVPRVRFGQARKIPPPPEFDSWTVQPVASRYIDWDIDGRVFRQNKQKLPHS
jgi:hypothetical protein